MFNSSRPAAVCRKAAVIFAFATGFLGSSLSPVEAASYHRVTFRPAAKKACVFNFPKDFTLGQIAIADSPEQSREKWRTGAARGQVSVGAGKYVTFVPSGSFFLKPDLIKYLPPQGIDSLEVTASSMDDAEDGLCDRGLARIGKLKSLIKLSLDRSDASDKGAIFARELPQLQELSAFAALIEGACFADFSRLKNLSVVLLHGNPIKDQNLKYLPAIAQLRALCLSSCGISDRGIGNLVGCNKLALLDLGANPKITDRSVASLVKLKSLREILLGGTSITYSGLTRMKGLHLKLIKLPGQSYTVAQLNTLRKVFPDAALEVNGDGVRAVDADTRQVYAPLH